MSLLLDMCIQTLSQWDFNTQADMVIRQKIADQDNNYLTDENESTTVCSDAENDEECDI